MHQRIKHQESIPVSKSKRQDIHFLIDLLEQIAHVLRKTVPDGGNDYHVMRTNGDGGGKSSHSANTAPVNATKATTKCAG